MIRLSNVWKSFGRRRALRGLSFEINSGQVTALLGLNGAGKTTTLRLITGFYQPDQGQIHFGDHLGSTLQQRCRMGYLPENNPLYADMTAMEHLRLVAGLRGLSGKQARRAQAIVLHQCELEPVPAEPVSELSKGIRQRIGLALALLGEPEYLLLDEPGSGLDPNQMQRLHSLIQELGTSRTLLLSTHRLEQAFALCERLLILRAGELVYHGTPQNLLADQSPEAAQLHVAAEPATVRLRLADLPYVTTVTHLGQQAGFHRYRLVGKLDADQLRSLFDRLSDLPLCHFAAEPIDLQACFAERVAT